MGKYVCKCPCSRPRGSTASKTSPTGIDSMTQNFRFATFSTVFLLFLTPVDHQTGPVVVVQIDQCNQLYAGVDNAITVLVQQEGAVSLDQVTADGCRITGRNGHFYVNPKSPGELALTVKTAKGDASFKYRVVPVGPVLALLGAQYRDGSQLGNGAFKAQGGMAAMLNCCGFDARCEIVSYTIIRVSKDNKVERAENTGARYGNSAQKIVQNAGSGDTYVYSHILAKCPGDTAPRVLNNVVIDIR